MNRGHRQIRKKPVIASDEGKELRFCEAVDFFLLHPRTYILDVISNGRHSITHLDKCTQCLLN